MSLIFKIAKAVQIFLIRKNMAGGMADYVMAITTVGRVTGNEYTTPVAYLQDGPHYVAFTRKTPLSDWYKNARKAAEAVLEIKGEGMAVYAEEILDETERQRLFELYKQAPATFERLFGVSLDAPAEELQAVLETRTFLHFTRIVP